MISYLEKIKHVSNRLLKEGKVDVVIGFRKGTVPMMNEPYFARTEQDIQNMVWDSNCGINLANYLTLQRDD
jgi:formate dehydrogenase subunit beta